VHAEITDATLQALPGILNPGQDGYDDTNEEPACDPAIVEDLFEAPIDPPINRQAPIHHDNRRTSTGKRDEIPEGTGRRGLIIT